MAAMKHRMMEIEDLHAAECYPKLVEALKNIAKWTDPNGDQCMSKDELHSIAVYNLTSCGEVQS